jgi:crooked neck
MEEMCRETAKARSIFDRWMAFEPDHAPWMAYIKVGLNHLRSEGVRSGVSAVPLE